MADDTKTPMKDKPPSTASTPIEKIEFPVVASPSSKGGKKTRKRKIRKTKKTKRRS